MPPMLTDPAFWHVVNVTAAAVGQTTFVILYLSWPWWRNFLGRALFFKAVVFCLLVDIAVASLFTDWPHEYATMVALYGLVALGIWGQVAAFGYVRFSGRQDQVSGNPLLRGSAGKHLIKWFRSGRGSR